MVSCARVAVKASCSGALHWTNPVLSFLLLPPPSSSFLLLPQFVSFEQRDPFALKQQQDEPTITAWDRFARIEYGRLAMEEVREILACT